MTWWFTLNNHTEEDIEWVKYFYVTGGIVARRTGWQKLLHTRMNALHMKELLPEYIGTNSGLR